MWTYEYIVQREAGQFSAQQVDALRYGQSAIQDQAGLAPVFAQTAAALQGVVAELYGELFGQGFEFLQDDGFIHWTRL